MGKTPISNQSSPRTYQIGGAIVLPQFGTTGTVSPYGLGTYGLSSVVDNGFMQVYSKDNVYSNRNANPNMLFMADTSSLDTSKNEVDTFHRDTLKANPNVSAYVQGEARRLPQRLISNEDNDTIIVYGNRGSKNEKLPDYVREKFKSKPTVNPTKKDTDSEDIDSESESESINQPSGNFPTVVYPVFNDVSEAVNTLVNGVNDTILNIVATVVSAVTDVPPNTITPPPQNGIPQQGNVTQSNVTGKQNYFGNFRWEEDHSDDNNQNPVRIKYNLNTSRLELPKKKKPNDKPPSGNSSTRIDEAIEATVVSAVTPPSHNKKVQVSNGIKSFPYNTLLEDVDHLTTVYNNKGNHLTPRHIVNSVAKISADRIKAQKEKDRKNNRYFNPPAKQIVDNNGNNSNGSQKSNGNDEFYSDNNYESNKIKPKQTNNNDNSNSNNNSNGNSSNSSKSQNDNINNINNLKIYIDRLNEGLQRHCSTINKNKIIDVLRKRGNYFDINAINILIDNGVLVCELIDEVYNGNIDIHFDVFIYTLNKINIIKLYDSIHYTTIARLIKDTYSDTSKLDALIKNLSTRNDHMKHKINEYLNICNEHTHTMYENVFGTNKTISKEECNIRKERQYKILLSFLVNSVVRLG